MQREPCEEFDPRRTRSKSCLQAQLEEGKCIILRVHAYSKTLPQLKNEDPDFHAASVQQNAAYNALQFSPPLATSHSNKQ